MSEANKDVVRRIQEAYSGGDLDALDELVAPDIVSHDAPPGAPAGLEGAKMGHRMLTAAFPDYHITLEELVAEGDRVVQRFTVSGTHKGEFMGFPPSGKGFTIPGYSEYRIAGGRAVEHWGVQDLMGCFIQLGLVPAPGQ